MRNIAPFIRMRPQTRNSDFRFPNIERVDPAAPVVLLCPECDCTHGVHAIDCPVLLAVAKLLPEDNEWARGIRWFNGELGKQA